MFVEIRLVVQLALGLVFLLSTASKIFDPKGFLHGVADYEILPRSLAYLVALLVIPLEGWLAVAHLTGWLLTVAVPIGLGTLTIFAAAVGVNLRRGRALPCYCFGAFDGETISVRTLARLFLLSLCEVLLFAEHRSSTTGRLLYSPQVFDFQKFGFLLLLAVFLLVAGSWILSFPDLVILLRPRKTSRSQMRPGNLPKALPSTDG